MQKKIRVMLKDKNLFTVPKVMRRFIKIGYAILLIFLASLISFVCIEVQFAERTQETSIYINQPAQLNSKFVEIGFYTRILTLVAEENLDYVWLLEDSIELQVEIYKE